MRTGNTQSHYPGPRTQLMFLLFFIALISSFLFFFQWDRVFLSAGHASAGETTADYRSSSRSQITLDYYFQSTGPLPKPSKKYRIGAVLRFLGNPYYQEIARGMYDRALDFGMFLDVQAGSSISDQEGQRAVLEQMLSREYNAYLVTPMTTVNLNPALATLKEQDILLVNIDQSLLTHADYYIGPDHYNSGQRLAEHFLAHYPDGGRIIWVRSQMDDPAEKLIFQGFQNTVQVADVTIFETIITYGDFQIAFSRARDFLEEYSDLSGFYCTDDISALGVSEAVRMAGRESVAVMGRDGMEPAIQSIQEGKLTGTLSVDPYELGRTAIEATFRLLEGQGIKKRVFTPQRIVTGTVSSDKSRKRDR